MKIDIVYEKSYKKYSKQTIRLRNEVIKSHSFFNDRRQCLLLELFTSYSSDGVLRSTTCRHRTMKRSFWTWKVSISSLNSSRSDKKSWNAMGGREIRRRTDHDLNEIEDPESDTSKSDFRVHESVRWYTLDDIKSRLPRNFWHSFILW